MYLGNSYRNFILIVNLSDWNLKMDNFETDSFPYKSFYSAIIKLNFKFTSYVI